MQDRSIKKQSTYFLKKDLDVRSKISIMRIRNGKLSVKKKDLKKKIK